MIQPTNLPPDMLQRAALLAQMGTPQVGADQGPGPSTIPDSLPGGFGGGPFQTAAPDSPDLPNPTDPGGSPVPPKDTTGSTTEPTKTELPDPTKSDSGDLTQNSGESNADYFIRLLNSGKYKDPQAAIDYFNGLGLGSDKASGLSSHYGSSPALYDKNGQMMIGLPDRYLVRNDKGGWDVTMRGSASDPNQYAGGDFHNGLAVGGSGGPGGLPAPPQGMDLSAANASNPDEFLQSLLDYARRLIMQGSTLPGGGAAQSSVDKGALLSQMNGQ